MPIGLTDYIKPKNDAFTGIIQASQVLGGGGDGTLPDATVAESNVTQHEAALTLSNQIGPLSVAKGGSGQTTQQAAIDALTNVSGATNEHVLTKDTATGNAIFKAAAGGGGGLNNVVEDITPQLGGQLDVNGQVLGDGTRELLAFVEDALAVNHLEIENEAAGSGPILRAVGDDVNVDLHLDTKGSGHIKIDDDVEFIGTASYDAEVDNGNSGTTKTIDWTGGNKQKVTLTGNCTFSFTDPPGPCNLILKVTQDGTGDRTTTWPSTVKWPGGTKQEVSGVASSVSLLILYFDGTNYYAGTGTNYS